jgi:hypothetical protein
MATETTGAEELPPVFFPAYAAVNVKQHVPIDLSLERPNFSKWKSFFTTLCGKYGLLDHINGTVAARPADPMWSQPDACVRGWMYNSVDDAVLDLAMEPDQDARALYVFIEALFQANKESRAVVLEQEFHNLSQGDLSIDTYAQQMKSTADALREVGHTVSPAQLVLNLLLGLNPRFANTADIIANTSPLPDFKSATNMLRVKELRLGTENKEASASALAVSTAPSCTSPACHSTSSSFSNGGSGKGKGRGGNGGGRDGGGRRNQQHGGGRRNQQHGGSRQPPQSTGPWVCYNPWTGLWPPQQQRWAPPQQQQWAPTPPPPQQAHTAFAPPQFSAAGAPSGGWNAANLIVALNQMAVQDSPSWVMDSEATSHMSSNDGILLSRYPSPPCSITVGNGQSIPSSGRGTSLLPIADRYFHLNNVLVAPQLARNLLSVRQLTRDNNCSIEFDASVFSVKDLQTKTVLLRCNSNGDLYTIPHRLPPRCHVAVVTPELWHARLGHPAPAAVQTLNKLSAIQCNKAARRICHACQLGKHARLPFDSSVSNTSTPFELVHCDVWTSPVLSISGYKYYLVILDDFTHFCWTFPLRHKSEVHEHIVQFTAYANTQFSSSVRCFQTDNGTEFINSATAAARGILLCTSCPYTSAQNGKAERMLRTLNNVIRMLLIHAAMSPPYWAEALSTVVFLTNRQPSSSIHNGIPYHLLYREMPDYSLLRVFGCLCYPNLSATTPHKLSPHSAACVFLGYPPSQKGYRCLDLSTRKIIISRHVVFDETHFPFAASKPRPDFFDFLLQDLLPAPASSTSDVRQTRASDDASDPVGLDPAILWHDAAYKLPQVPRQTAPTSTSSGASAATAGSRFDIHYSRRPRPAPAPAPQAVVPQPAEPPARETRSRTGSLPPPIQRYGFTAAASSLASSLPGSTRVALVDANWRAAMTDEYKALVDNGTWRLVPRPPHTNVISGKWVFKHKYRADGSLARHKARWVVRGFSQRHGIDYDETFSPVVKPPTIRVVLSIAASRSWPIHQLDVKNAFLHGHLNETVYCEQPPGFVDPVAPDHVCLLQKSLYGLKQAPRAWHQRFSSFVQRSGFTASASDTSLFIYKEGADFAYLLLYVDDIILTTSSTRLLRHLTELLHSEFAMTDLGDLHHFLGISVTCSKDGLFLSQR